MKRLLGLLLVLGFVFSSSLYAVAYVDYGYSSVYGVNAPAFFSDLEFFYSNADEEPYKDKLCSEDQMEWFREYLDCTEKFLRLKWGFDLKRVEDVFILGNGWGGSPPPIGQRFTVVGDFPWSEEYFEFLESGALELDDSWEDDKYIRNLTCWEKGWGDGRDIYDFRKSYSKSVDLWNKYYAYDSDWHNHFDGVLHDTVLSAYYHRNNTSRAEMIDNSCAQFVSYCRTGNVSDKDISWIENEREKSQIMKYRNDGIDVIFIAGGVGGPTNASYLVATPDDCLRYYKKADIAFSEPYVLGGK
jgi:hypothetical protein